MVAGLFYRSQERATSPDLGERFERKDEIIHENDDKGILL